MSLSSDDIIFKDDILTAYKTVQLEEDIKSLKNTCGMMKQDRNMITGLQHLEFETEGLLSGKHTHSLEWKVLTEKHTTDQHSLSRKSKDLYDLINQIQELEQAKEILSSLNLEQLQLLFKQRLQKKNQLIGEQIIPTEEIKNFWNEMYFKSIVNTGKLNACVDETTTTNLSITVNKNLSNVSQCNVDKQENSSFGDENIEEEKPNDSADAFSQRFLLQSTIPEENMVTTIDGEDANIRLLSLSMLSENFLKKDIGIAESSEIDICEDGFKVSVHGGTILNSHMEDLFIPSTKDEVVKIIIDTDPGSGSNCKLSTEVNCSLSSIGCVAESTDSSVKAVSEGSVLSISTQAVCVVSDVGRPVSKGRYHDDENQENTEKQQYQQIITLKQDEEQSLSEKLQKTKTMTDDLHQPLKSQESFVETSRLFREKNDEEQNRTQFESVQLQEEGISSLKIMELELKARNAEHQNLLINLDKCNYKLRNCQKECNQYRIIVEEQELLLKEEHRNNSTMQQNFNEVCRALKSKDEELQRYCNTTTKIFHLETLLNLKGVFFIKYSSKILSEKLFVIFNADCTFES